MAGSAQPPLNRNQFGLRGVEYDAATGKTTRTVARGQPIARENDNSKIMTWAVLGVAGIGVLGFFAFGMGRNVTTGPQVYTDVTKCAAARIVPAQSCQTEWKTALSFHHKNAPTYPTAATCERVHGVGKCIRPETPGDPLRAASYIPMMAAYVVGKAADGRFEGAPLHQFASDGPNKYRVTEARPQTAGATDGAEDAERKRSGGSGMFLFLRTGMANAAAPAASAAPKAGAVPANGKPAPGGAQRGGMGATAKGKGGGG
jgi:uncharacterized protein YgiB involved in biofilm formation